MYHYHAAQLTTDDGGRPVGPFYYVRERPDRPLSPQDATGYCTTKAKCKGHTSAYAARGHQREYYLDNANFGHQTPGTYSSCEVCGAQTDWQAVTGPGNSETHSLCDDHRNRAGLDAVLGDVGDLHSDS